MVLDFTVVILSGIMLQLEMPLKCTRSWNSCNQYLGFAERTEDRILPLATLQHRERCGAHFGRASVGQSYSGRIE